MYENCVQVGAVGCRCANFKRKFKENVVLRSHEFSFIAHCTRVRRALKHHGFCILHVGVYGMCGGCTDEGKIT